MGLCANGKQPIIEWQYTGENKQQIIGADNYSLSQEKGKCPVKYHAFGTYVDKQTTGCNQVAYWRTAVSLNGADVRSFVPVISPSNESAISLLNGSFASIRPINKSSWDSRNLGDTPGLSIYNYPAELACVNETSPGYGHSFNVVEIKRIDGLLDNCGNCIFTITKNGSIVYQKTNPTCPTVNVVCDEQCPPGTCQCDCGSMVCCYDTTTGKAVKSFRK